MALKLKKCFFFSDDIDYFEHMITPGWPHIATKTTNNMQYLNYPTTTSEPRSLLELCNVYSQIVLNFAEVASLCNLEIEV